MGDQAKLFALKLMHDLRLKGVSVQMDVMGRNFKNQFKLANRVNAAKTVIIGENELNEGKLQIKDMESGEQTSVPIESIMDELTK
jgi:histidyl-tRNA synthetase